MLSRHYAGTAAGDCAGSDVRLQEARTVTAHLGMLQRQPTVHTGTYMSPVSRPPRLCHISGGIYIEKIRTQPGDWVIRWGPNPMERLDRAPNLESANTIDKTIPS